MEILLALLGGSAVTGTVELIKFIRSRRQLNAQAGLDEARTDLVQVQTLQAIVDTLSTQVTSALGRVNELSRQLDEANEKIKRHLPWDEDVAHRLAKYEPVPPRPPL